MRTDRRDRPGGKPDLNPSRRGGDRPAGDLLYGRNAVAEALGGRRRNRALLLAEGVKEDDRIRRLTDLAAKNGVAVLRLPRGDLDRRTAFANHQGVALESSAFPYTPFEELTSTPGTILLLDHLQDPQNFGTLLRAAEATGVAGVVLPRDRSVDVTPAVVNASSGAVEHLRVARVPNLMRAIEDLKSAGWWAAALDVGHDAVDLFRAQIPTPLALVVGAEGAGVTQNVRRHCDLVVSIPMVGRVASLNAATAGAIALYELLRRAQIQDGQGD